MITEAALASLILDVDPLQLVAAADAARDGTAALLLAMLRDSQGLPAELLEDDSIGDNMAGNCNDYDTAHGSRRPVDVRGRKLTIAGSAMPDDAFAPFSKARFANNPPDICIEWPAPTTPRVVAPAGATTSVPALVLSGDMDRVIPTLVSKRLLGTVTKRHPHRHRRSRPPDAGIRQLCRFDRRTILRHTHHRRQHMRQPNLLRPDRQFFAIHC